MKSFMCVMEIDNSKLRQVYPKRDWLKWHGEGDGWVKAYQDIKQEFISKGFDFISDTVYCTYDRSEVDAILAIEKISKNLPWFKEIVYSIQLFKVDEIFDMKPAL